MPSYDTSSSYSSSITHYNHSYRAVGLCLSLCIKTTNKKMLRTNATACLMASTSKKPEWKHQCPIRSSNKKNLKSDTDFQPSFLCSYKWGASHGPFWNSTSDFYSYEILTANQNPLSLFNLKQVKSSFTNYQPRGLAHAFRPYRTSFNLANRLKGNLPKNVSIMAFNRLFFCPFLLCWCWHSPQLDCSYTCFALSSNQH